MEKRSSCRFCGSSRIILKFEGWIPRVREFYTCGKHSSDGDVVLMNCGRRSVALLVAVSREELEGMYGSVGL